MACPLRGVLIAHFTFIPCAVGHGGVADDPETERARTRMVLSLFVVESNALR